MPRYIPDPGPGLADDITRAWDWLDHWGHNPDRRPLDGLRPHQLIGIRDQVQHRVRVLAETWEQWWPDLVDLEIVAAVLAGFPPVALAVSAHLLVRTAAAR